MQKVISFLEKNVEWMVLGLAGLWVLYVVWFYVITPPVTVELGGQQFTPAAIDQHIRDTEAVALESKMSHSTVPPMQVPDFSEQFVKEMGIRDVPPLPITIVTFNSAPQASQIQGPGTGPNEQLRPTELAKLPTPVIREPIFTRDQVVFNADPNNRDKPLPPNAQLPPGVNFVQSRADKQVVTVPARWDENLVVAAFKAAKIEDILQRREYLSIELEREEMTGIDANGNPAWGNKVLVPPLEMYKAPVDKKANPDEFKNWVTRAEIQPWILQPQMYNTVTKPWTPPVTVQEEGVAGNVQPEVVAPKNAVEAFGALRALPPAQQQQYRNSLSPEMRREVFRLEQEEAEKERMQRRPQQREQQPRPRRTSWVPTPSQFLATALFGQLRPGAEHTGVPPQGAAGANNPWNNAAGGGGVGMMGAANFQGMNQPPKVWDIWAHDETVQPGKTYRYRLRVTMKNPLYQTKNIAADPKLAEILELPANPDEGWSDWTQPVRVPSQLEFFVNGTTPGGQNATPQVKFNIFRWQHGRFHQTTTASLQPGDMIGTRTGDPASGVDYTTGWTVVDVRPTGNGDARVVLMDPQGRSDTRFMKADQNNPQQRILSLELQRAPQANAGGR